MQNLEGLVASLLSTSKAIDLEEGEWELAMADALLIHVIKEAAARGESPREHVDHIIMMVQERAIQWLG